MLAPPTLPDEDNRLAALAEYGLTPDSSQDEVGKILALAARLFEVPTVLLSLVERHRQIFAARIGLDACETSRDVSFCAHALAGDDVFVVPDATLDPRFQDNPLVTGHPHIRFYAGVPLKGPTGYALGTVCLIDSKPRPALTDVEAKNLRDFCSLVLDRLEIRRLERARREGQARFEQIAATSPDGIVCTDHAGRVTFWSDAAAGLFGYSPAEAHGRCIDAVIPIPTQGGQRCSIASLVSGRAQHSTGATIELTAHHRDGTEVPIELSLSEWLEGGANAFGLIIRNIADRRANEARLFRLAHLDTLTDLPNRTVFRDRLEHVTQASSPASVVLIDLDGFKEVNDTLGHSAGDTLLMEVAAKLLTCVSSTDTVARLGGDEFALLLPGCDDPARAAELASRAIAAIASIAVVDGQNVNIGASAGVALFPAHGSRAEDLMAHADLALYQAKAEGRQCARFFSPCLRQAAINRQEQETELRRAAEMGEFELFYQPQVSGGTGSLAGAEALIRWRHPERGLLSPAAFLPTLENSRLAAPVGAWVIRTACRQAAAWRRASPRFRMGVNLFGVQFRTNLVETVQAALEENNLPSSALELEITENIILRHDDAMMRPIHTLRDQGIGIAFDDFGTGYASLSLLKRFPLTRLKVDQSFVRNMCKAKGDAAIVRAIILLGRSFDLSVVAEGVETADQEASLVAEGCEEMQGYHYGKPMPAREFEAAFHLHAPSLEGCAA